jgi:FkbM family methyltransferase
MPEEEILMLPKLITRGGVAIDVGANIGLYSFALSKICDTVEAFEPNPKNQNIIRAYNAPNINVHGIALSSKGGVGELNIPIVNDVEIDGHASLNSKFLDQVTIQVDLKKLDDYNFGGVNYIKIDVEGHELEVIKGAVHTIKTNRPVLMVEIEQRHISTPMGDVFGEIIKFGYKGYFINQNKFHELSDFSYEKYQRPLLKEGHNDEKRKYVNNFIFIPNEESLNFEL